MFVRARQALTDIPKPSIRSTPSFLRPPYSVHHELCFVQSSFSKIQCAYVAWIRPPHARAKNTRARISPPRTSWAWCPACPAARARFSGSGSPVSRGSGARWVPVSCPCCGFSPWRLNVSLCPRCPWLMVFRCKNTVFSINIQMKEPMKAVCVLP